MDTNDLKRVISTCTKFGTSSGGRISYTYAALRESAEAAGITLPSARAVFAAMRSIGFEDTNSGRARFVAAPLRTVVGPIIVEAAVAMLAQYEASKSANE